MVRGQRPIEVAGQLDELTGEVVWRRLSAIALQGEGRTRISAGRRSDESVTLCPGASALSMLKVSATLSGL